MADNTQQISDLPPLQELIQADDQLVVRRASDNTDYRLSGQDALAPTRTRAELPDNAMPGLRLWVPDCPKPPTAATDARGAACVFDGHLWFRAGDYGSIVQPIDRVLGNDYGMFIRPAIGNIFQDVEGTVPVDAEQQTVARINDGSANDVDLIASSVSRRANWDGSHIRNDGVDDAYVAQTQFAIGDGLPLYFAYRFGNLAGNDTYRSLFTLDSQSRESFHLGARDDGFIAARLLIGSGALSVDATAETIATGFHTIEFSCSSSGDIRLSLDGEQIGSNLDNADLVEGESSSNCTLTIFDGTAMDFIGLVAVQADMSDAERSDVRHYLEGL